MKRTVLLLSMLAFSAGVFAQGGGWQAPRGVRQIEIWPTGAVPDMEGITLPPERVETTKAPDVVAGRPYAAVYNVAKPTMTIFPPKGRNTGVSMVVFPGGGFKLLAMDLEGTEICNWMTSKGIHGGLVR